MNAIMTSHLLDYLQEREEINIMNAWARAVQTGQWTYQIPESYQQWLRTVEGGRAYWRAVWRLVGWSLLAKYAPGVFRFLVRQVHGDLPFLIGHRDQLRGVTDG